MLLTTSREAGGFMKLKLEITDVEIREAVLEVKSDVCFSGRRLSATELTIRHIADRLDTASRSQKCGWAVADLVRPIVREHEARIQAIVNTVTDSEAKQYGEARDRERGIERIPG